MHGQKNPNHIMIWIFLILRTPNSSKKCMMENMSFLKTLRLGLAHKSYLFMAPSFCFTVTRPLRLKSTQALGIMGFWGSVNR